jgi:hypothetical protein
MPELILLVKEPGKVLLGHQILRVRRSGAVFLSIFQIPNSLLNDSQAEVFD